ncbi:carbonate dehydratase, eukaryotic-type, partial [Cooperia oncophora]
LFVSDNEWSYVDADHWGGTCSTGRQQSPINLNSSVAESVEWKPLEFKNYGSGIVTVRNTGHSAEVDGFPDWVKRPYVTGGNLPGKYYLQQLHLHWGDSDSTGSENTIDGRQFSMEAHLVHFIEGMDKTEAAGAQNKIAVIGVLLQASSSGVALQNLENTFTEIRTPGIIVCGSLGWSGTGSHDVQFSGKSCC